MDISLRPVIRRPRSKMHAAMARGGWEPVIDTTAPAMPADPELVAGGESYRLEARSLALLREVERRKVRRK